MPEIWLDFKTFQNKSNVNHPRTEIFNAFFLSNRKTNQKRMKEEKPPKC